MIYNFFYFFAFLLLNIPIMNTCYNHLWISVSRSLGWMYTEKCRHTGLHQTFTSQSKLDRAPNQSSPLLQPANCWAVAKRYTKDTLHKMHIIYHLNHTQTCLVYWLVSSANAENWMCFFSYSWSFVRAAISGCKHSLMWPKRIWSWAKTCTRQTESN